MMKYNACSARYMIIFMKNTDLIIGDYFALANSPNEIYMITEAGINNAPLLTTNNPALTNYIGTYFSIKPEDKINYIPKFHFLTPTLIDFFSVFTKGFPFNNSTMFKQGDYWIYNDNLYLTLSKNLHLIVHSKNPDLIGTLSREYYDLHYTHSTTFKPDFNWLTLEGKINEN